MKRILPIVIMLAVCADGMAQGGVKNLVKKVGKMIDSLTIRGVDHRYIEAPEKPWQLIVKSNLNQSLVKMHTQGAIGDRQYNASPSLKTEPTAYVGLWLGYRGYGLGYTVNVGGNNGSFFNIGATGGRYGATLRINSFRSYHPHINLDSDLISEVNKDGWSKRDLEDPIKVRALIANAYYLLNGKRFSYAAAYDQSVVQKRSSGSLLAGAMYFYASIDYGTNSNADLVYLMHGLGRLKMWQGGVGLGYAYNWVPTRGLLISAMAVPMLTFVNKVKGYAYDTNVPELLEGSDFMNEEITDEQWNSWHDNLRITPSVEKTYNSGLTVNLDLRLSVTYNFSRYFMNCNGEFNNFRVRKSTTNGRLENWVVNASFGVRL